MNRTFAVIIAAVAGLFLQSTVLRAAVLPNPTVTGSATPFSAAFIASNVFDSRRAEFASQGSGVNTFIEFDFGAPVTIDRFMTLSRQNPLDVIGESRLIFSSDGTFDAADPAVVFNPSGSNGDGLIQSFAAQTARHVRWEVVTSTGTSQNLGSQEMRFLNTPPNSAIIPGVTVINSAPPFNVATYAAANAVNGNAGRDGPGREYASLGQGASMFIDFDLGSSQPVIGFDYFDRLSETEDVSGFDLIFSDDPSFSTVITTKNYAHPLGDGYTTTDTFASAVTARYVRLDATFIDGVGTNTGVAEMIFYAVPEPASSTLAAAALSALVLLRLIARRRRSH
jgi:hypothetical protein